MNNNIPKIEEAITLLYQTHIEDDEIANHRGIAIRAMNKMVELLGGEDVVEKIEAVPWSKRMRAQHLFEDGPQRTWVGLTDDEQQELFDAWQKLNDGWGSFYELIQAKLKEKNT
jgi:hypothetical protein